MGRCGFKKRPDLLDLLPGHSLPISSWQVRPPDDCCLGRVVLDPATKPGTDLRSAGMLLERGHRPGINDRSSECGSEAFRGRGCHEEPAAPGTNMGVVIRALRDGLLRTLLESSDGTGTGIDCR